MGNRHYPPSVEEVWSSYEWLVKSKLEELDHMARCIYREMMYARSKPEMVRQLMAERFAELWECVAEEQEQKTKYRRRDGA